MCLSYSNARVNDAPRREPIFPSENIEVMPVVAYSKERPGMFGKLVFIRLHSAVPLRGVTHKVESSDDN
jgi:hypothetical protein